MSTRTGRVARGSLLAFFATLVAAVSHSLAGGTMPGAAGIALSLVFSTFACIALACRELSLWRSAVSIAASQFLFHAFFSGLVGSTAHIAGATSHHAQLPALAPNSELHSGHESPWMWAAHAVAALVTLAAARKGEKAVAALEVLAGLVVRPLLAALASAIAVPIPSSMRMHADPSDTPHRLHALISPLRHRGPPAIQFV